MLGAILFVGIVVALVLLIRSTRGKAATGVKNSVDPNPPPPAA